MEAKRIALELRKRERANIHSFTLLKTEEDPVVAKTTENSCNFNKAETASSTTESDSHLQVESIKSLSFLDTIDSTGVVFTLSDSQRLCDRFKLQSVLGRGASGSVFLAYDERLERNVAIKIFHQPVGDDPGVFEHFLGEARNLAKLSHPGIVQIHEIGETVAAPFLVAELVDGPTLRELLFSQGSINHRFAAWIVAEIAIALDYAHRCGVIHRDLKPSNILLHARGDSHAELPDPEQRWDVKIADFGLARRIEGSGANRSNKSVGTPAYMSPEAAQGDVGGVDGRSDIFSLGVILFELLTGQLPFTGAMPEVLSLVRNCEIPRPHSLKSRIPADLEAICLKCLEKLPGNRYRDAGELRSDLIRWLDGYPVTAKKTSRIAIATKWCRRQPLAAASLGLLAGVLPICIALFFIVVGLWNAVEYANNQAMIATLIEGDGPAVAASLLEIRKHPVAIKIVQERLRGESSMSPAKARLLLVEGPKLPTEAQSLYDFMISHASPVEFQLTTDYLDQFAPTLHLSNADGKDEESLIRAAICNLRWSQDDVELRRCTEALADLLCSQRSHKRVAPWVELLKPYRQELFAVVRSDYIENMPPRLLGESGCEAAIRLCRGDTMLLCSLIEIVDGAELSEVQEELALQREGAIAKLVGIADALRDQIEATIAADGDGTDLLEVEAAWNHYSRVITAIMVLGPERTDWMKYFVEDDPRLDTYFIESASRRGMTIDQINDLLHRGSNVLAQRALVLSLGGFRPASIKANPNTINWLKAEYPANRSGGVHSAIRYILERIGEQEWATKVDRELKGSLRPGYEWFVNSIGMTMVIVSPSEQRPKLLPAKDLFAISANEVTWRQLRYLGIETHSPISGPQPTLSSPVTWVSIDRALEFCQSLDLREGIPAEEQSSRRFAMTAPDASTSSPAKSAVLEQVEFEIDCRKRGYRLPNMREIRDASQGGCVTSLFFGGPNTPYSSSYINFDSHADLLSTYERMPNRYGIFHSIGNARELTIDPPPEGNQAGGTESADEVYRVNTNDRVSIFDGDVDWRVGGWPKRRPLSHPAKQGQPSIGFRIACTIQVRP